LAFLLMTASPGSQEEKFISIRGRIQYLAGTENNELLVSLADSLERATVNHSHDTLYLADLYYYSGVCKYLIAKYNEALTDFNNSITAKKEAGVTDENYSKALYNAGISAYLTGDYMQSISFSQEFLELNGNDTTSIIDAYSMLAGASMEYQDYESFVRYSLKALNIISGNPEGLQEKSLVNLYGTMGAGYSNMADFAKAKLYLEKAENLFYQSEIPVDENYINLINSLAYTYGALGDTIKEEVYFEKGISLAVKSKSALSFNLINSYANNIGNSGNLAKGEALLYNVLSVAEKTYGSESRTYFDVLKYYANYLVLNNYKLPLALDHYGLLLNYVREHPKDISMKNEITLGYARALLSSGSESEALGIIQNLLNDSGSGKVTAGTGLSGKTGNLNADKMSVKILQLKHDILQALYNKTGDIRNLTSSAEISEQIVSVIERMRLRISEEESSLLLSGRYRDSYISAISDYEKCYRITREYRFLEKAFEYAERSKAAGLLASTRQMKAVEFHIPAVLAEREKLLQHEIGFYNSLISKENDKEIPDSGNINSWNEKLIQYIARRDSLLLTFEKDFPGYYKLKYNSSVPLMDEIPSITGRNCNYLSYVVSDSALYVFLVNRKHREMLTVRTDEKLQSSIILFRELLSDDSQAVNAREKFNRYRQTGLYLYNTLVEPLEKYFIGDNLLISADNVLSYVPFETFLYSIGTENDMLYRNLDYLMKRYNISYSYSATFMKETSSIRVNGKNRLVAFAPSYPYRMNIDSLLSSRQSGNLISDLPFARQEAEYVTDITGGTLYQNNDATETFYKSNAPDYNIIHLAMHAVVNDRHPMNSAMIFATEKDSVNDGTLYTYEVYGIPLRSRMVVLSSCNTGTGALYSGEGILSLARGFLYSGSRSVVMSLWKIEDRSGTDIVTRFYANLKKGMSKSKALRKSRNDYLKSANQVRSHPYFWSTLVVFGDDSPVYFSWKRFGLISLAVVIPVVLLIIYFRKRRYS
ncbi:MAG TPA: CHAT domain-containing protein, partial [Bacteroidales bacterium]|nr:CHAT domain-containing protein [Bacteroidales bacterium]